MELSVPAVHETRAREMDQIMEVFETNAVPDKEWIVDSWSDLVWQPESHGDIIYRESGGHSRPV